VEIFLSWSGRKSKAVAEALRTWLPKVNPAFKPWLSTADIDKGARWASDVAERLETARAGIICLTPSNLHADWLLWEAGALSKTIKNTHVCTLLIGLEPSDVKPPLSQFQATRMTKDDLLALLSTLNSKLEDRAIPVVNLPETFSLWWPRLEAEFSKLPEDEDAAPTKRPERELIEEILALVRSQNRSAPVVLQAQEVSVSRQTLGKRISNILLTTYGVTSRVQVVDDHDLENWKARVITDRGTFVFTLKKSLTLGEMVELIFSTYEHHDEFPTVQTLASNAAKEVVAPTPDDTSPSEFNAVKREKAHKLDSTE